MKYFCTAFLQWRSQTFMVARAIRSYHQGSFKLHNSHIIAIDKSVK